MSVKTNQLIKFIEDNKETFIETSLAIHANPEIGNEEYFACEQLTKLLSNHNFDVETNVAGHETAFYAVYDSGKSGPTISYLAEYDALPGIGHACEIGRASCREREQRWGGDVEVRKIRTSRSQCKNDE